MFQARQQFGGNVGGLMFAPRPPIQTGDGFLSGLTTLFRRATSAAAPYLKSALKTGSNVARQIAKSDVVNEIKKGVINSTVDIGSNLLADLVSGESATDAVENANSRLQDSRKKIGNLMRSPDFSSRRAKPRKKKPPTKRKNVTITTVTKKKKPKTYSIFEEDA